MKGMAEVYVWSVENEYGEFSLAIPYYQKLEIPSEVDGQQIWDLQKKKIGNIPTKKNKET